MSNIPAPLPAVDCPICGTAMTGGALPDAGSAPVAATYEDCLRQCVTCRVGYSNARTAPTAIHADTLGNVPVEVRPGAMETLKAAINTRNRENKIRKFGFSSSEDAITWTVFTYLSHHRPDALATLVPSAFG